MKSILYVGATLMIGASIYGFVDYKNTSRKKEFRSMYENQEKILPAPLEEKKVNDIIPAKEVSEKADVKKSEVKTTNIKKETEVPVISKSRDFITPVDPIEAKTDATVKTDELKETKSIKKMKANKSKKLNYKLFSRGSLEERYVEKTLKPEEPKKVESKKTELKEQ